MVIVTGAAGFIGSHVARSLLARGERVVGVDNFDPFYDAAIKERNVRECESAARASRGSFELVRADVADADAMAAALKGARGGTVVHLAARAGVRPSIEDPVGYTRANVMGTAVVLDAARRCGAARVVVASSSSVYGNNERVPFAEDDPVERPISPYAATKRACELIGHAHWARTGMPTAFLRFFTVYGPGQRPDLAIATFMRRLAAAEPIRMYGDGSTSRDYTFIDDIVGGVVAACERIDGHGFRIWNLGSDSPVRLDALIGAVSRVVGREARIERAGAQPGDVERTWADLSRARAELAYSPRTTLEQGLERQWAWTCA